MGCYNSPLLKNFVLKIQMDNIQIERDITDDNQIKFIIYISIGRNNHLETK